MAIDRLEMRVLLDRFLTATRTESCFASGCKYNRLQEKGDKAAAECLLKEIHISKDGKCDCYREGPAPWEEKNETP